MVDPSREDPHLAQIKDVLRPKVESGEVSQEQLNSILSLTISYAEGKKLEALAGLDAADTGSAPVAGAETDEEPS
jgi:hypothetical protein